MRRLALALLVIVVALPVCAGTAVTLIEAVNPGAWTTLWEYPGLGRSIALSVWTAAAATLIALALAHLAVALAWTRRASNALRLAALPVIALPHLAVAIGLALALAPSGLLLRLVSPWPSGFGRPPDWLTIQDPLGLALIVGLVLKEVPFLALVLIGARAQVPLEPLMLQARSLGYAPLKAWFVSVAPLLERQIRLPLAAVAVFGMTNVEMAIALAPTMPPPFALVLWQWFTASRLELRAAAFAGSVLLLLVVLGALAAGGVAMAVARRAFHAYAESGRRGVRRAAVSVALASLPLLAGALTLAAVTALGLRAASPMWRFPALLDAAPRMNAIGRIAPTLGTAFESTAVLAGAISLAAVALALLLVESFGRDAVWRRRLGMLLFVPLLLPQLAFLFGLQWLLVGMRLDGTWIAVAWEHLVFALPYAWGIVAAARASLDPRLLLTARSLGAGALRVWAVVTLPLLLRSLLLAGALAFAVSAALYLPTLFAGAGRIVTLATEAAGAAASGDLRVAAVHGTAQALAPLVILVLSALIGAAIHRRRQGMPR